MEIACVDDIRNFFTRAQHQLDKEFGILEGRMGIWDGKIKNLGQFPLGSGWASRTTTLGFQRPRHTSIRFNPLVGLQDDCVTSCDAQANLVRLGNADHKWYRMTEYAENTEVFCLKSMWAEALSLREQLENNFRILKSRTAEIMDEYKRANYAALSANRWISVDDGSAVRAPRKNRWRFAEDVNGSPDVNYIILDSDIDPLNVSLLTIPNLNYIVGTGTYIGAFPTDGGAEIVTDFETIQQMPVFDTNVRADNRYRDPKVLDPSFSNVARRGYADYDWTADPFALRYYWTEDDPAYPNGVLKRIEHWQSEEVSEGCWDDISNDYQEGSFQLSIMYSDDVFGLQTLDLPTSLPGGTYSQPQSPYNGMWHFKNEVNEVTPCNQDRNKAYWRMILNLASKPIMSGKMGNIVLHRRFNSATPVKSCRPLQIITAGSYDCDDTCPALDHYPPALVTRTVCGAWNAAAATGCA